MIDMFAGLEPRSFACVCADPAWDHKSNSKERPGRNPRRHYATMSLEDIAALPVKDYVADNAVLFLWITGPFLARGYHLEIMRRWGFKPSGMGFVWLKLNKRASTMFVMPSDLFFGPGHTTRKNAEFCLLGKRGRSVRQSARVREVIVDHRREHSRKPEIYRERVEEYVGPGVPILELFSRESRPGWVTRGMEAGKFDLPQAA